VSLKTAPAATELLQHSPSPQPNKTTSHDQNPRSVSGSDRAAASARARLNEVENLARLQHSRHRNQSKQELTTINPSYRVGLRSHSELRGMKGFVIVDRCGVDPNPTPLAFYHEEQFSQPIATSRVTSTRSLCMCTWVKEKW